MNKERIWQHTIIIPSFTSLKKWNPYSSSFLLKFYLPSFSIPLYDDFITTAFHFSILCYLSTLILDPINILSNCFKPKKRLEYLFQFPSNAGKCVNTEWSLKYHINLLFHVPFFFSWEVNHIGPHYIQWFNYQYSSIK